MSDQAEAVETPLASLESILEGETETPEPEPVVEPAADPAPEEPKGEEPEGEEPKAEGEPPAPKEEDDGKTVPLQALHDERSKRQELERRLQQLEQNQKQQQPPAEAPDPIDDPQGYQKYQDERALNDRIELSMEIGREMHEDFDDVAKAFYEEAEKNPLLAQQAIQNKAPGLFMYREGQKILRQREIGDPEQYAARKVEEATADLRKELDELKAKLSTDEKRAQIPPSLADARSSGSGNPQQPSHTPMANILPD